MSERAYMVCIQDKLSENWRFEVRNWQSFVDTVGKDLLVNFARCFMHADRRGSLISLANAINEIDKATAAPSSPQFSRNLLTILSYAWGTKREFAFVTPALRGKITRRWPSMRQSQGWQRLHEFEKRWGSDASANSRHNLRNKIAFHVDEDIVRFGIVDLSSPVVLVRGKGELSNNQWADFATLATFTGFFGTDPEEFQAGLHDAIQKLKDDFNGPSQAVYSLFTGVIRQSEVQIIYSRETRARGNANGGSPVGNVVPRQTTPTANNMKAGAAGAT